MLFLTRPAAQRVEALDPAMMTYVVSVVRCPSRRGIFSPLHNPHPSCAGVVQCGVNERPNEVALEVSRLAEKRPLVVRSTSCQKAGRRDSLAVPAWTCKGRHRPWRGNRKKKANLGQNIPDIRRRYSFLQDCQPLPSLHDSVTHLPRLARIT